jgi:hypothetical protein
MSPTEGWIRVDAHAAWQVEISTIRASRGIGLARVAVDLSVRTLNETLVGQPMWLSGALHIHSVGLPTTYLCDLTAAPQPTAVPHLAQAARLALEGNLSLRQLKIVEAARAGKVEFEVELRGHALAGQGFVPFGVVRIDHTVEQSAWVDYLAAWGYRNVLLLEIDRPSSPRTRELARATDYLTEAQDQLLQHKPRSAVEALRQSLVALIGQDAPTDTSQEEVEAALRDARKAASDKTSPAVGYHRRLGLVPLALKFTTDLAAHPEEADTTHADAEALFLMTAGLIQRLGRDGARSL